MNLQFKETEGPGKCSKCGQKIPDHLTVYTALTLSGRPSLVKDQLIMVDPEFCEKCHKKVLGN